jgi:hypothetical protein
MTKPDAAERLAAKVYPKPDYFTFEEDHRADVQRAELAKRVRRAIATARRTKHKANIDAAVLAERRRCERAVRAMANSPDITLQWSSKLAIILSKIMWPPKKGKR